MAARRSCCAKVKQELNTRAAIRPCTAQPNSIMTKEAASTSKAMVMVSACAALKIGCMR